jgi:hypothetical protein
MPAISVDLTSPLSDALLVGSLVSAKRLVDMYNEKSLDSTETWLKKSIILILIFVVYDLVMSGTIVNMISKYRDEQSKELLASINDFVKFSTILATNQVAISYLYNTPLTGNQWMLKILGITLGYGIYNMSSQYMLNVGSNYQLIYNDFMKIGLGDIFGILLSKGTNINQSDLLVLLADFIGVAVYHYAAKPIASIPKDKGASSIPDEFISKATKYRM